MLTRYILLFTSVIACSLPALSLAKVGDGQRSHFSIELADDPSMAYAIDINRSSLLYLGIGHNSTTESAPNTTITTTNNYFFGYRHYLARDTMHEQSDYYLESLKLRIFVDFEYNVHDTTQTNCVTTTPTTKCNNTTETSLLAYAGLEYMLTDYFSVESKFGIALNKTTGSTEQQQLKLPQIKLSLNYYLDN
jgi:hypothetical protein